MSPEQREKRRLERERQVRRQKLMLAGAAAVIVVIIIIIIAANSASKSGQKAAEEAKAQEAAAVSAEEEAAPKKGSVSLFAAGDIMIGRVLRANYAENGISGILTDSLQSEMNSADICIANEEFAFTNNEEKYPDKEYNYKLDPSLVSTFIDMGIDLVTLANNHALDYMEEGLIDSIATLSNAGIQYAGAGKGLEEASALRTFEVNGQTIGVLAASRVLPEMTWNVTYGTFETAMFSAYDPADLYQAIEEADSACDFLIVYTHWGQMNTTELTDYQTEQAHTYIDKGADLVLGAHPHIPQGIEYYRDVPIFYSLGNFMFTGDDGKQFALKVTIDADSRPSCTLVPVISEDGVTKEMPKEDVSGFYAHMNEISTGAEVSDDGSVVNTSASDEDSAGDTVSSDGASDKNSTGDTASGDDASDEDSAGDTAFGDDASDEDSADEPASDDDASDEDTTGDT